MNRESYRSIWVSALLLLLSYSIFYSSAVAQEVVTVASTAPRVDVLSEAEWEQLDDSVDRALAWLASQQQRDGSFPTMPQGQPAITGLCAMAFLAHGKVPGSGEYGRELDQAIRYIASCQKRSGLIALMGPNGKVYRNVASGDIGGPLSYNHAISSLALSEIYSTAGARNAQLLDQVITSSLRLTLEMQRWRKRREEDVGGWRYLHEHNLDAEPFDSDLSATGWYLMSLRSAKNAGFDVPKESIDDAVEYIRRCFHQEYGTFHMVASKHDRRSRGMAGAGVLALAHAGFHNSEEAALTGEWILKHDFNDYNRPLKFTVSYVDDRYHYSVFNCCQAMYQLGGSYWERFFPPTAKVLLNNQQPTGSWPPESNHEGHYGETYTTALVLLSLGAPNQLLPVFQR